MTTHPPEHSEPASGPGPAPGPGSGSPTAAAVPPIYILPPKPPSLFRSLLAGLGRFVAVAALILLFFGALAAWLGAGAGGGRDVVAEPYRIADGDASAIAIVDVTGPIDDAAADRFRRLADFVIDRPQYQAVVIRVDSPGGTVTASDHIWNHVERIKAEGLDVVVSCGGVTASGGYYAACAADRILAEPTSVVGSIGVILRALTMGDLLDKIGVDPVTIVASESPDKDLANDIFRDWDEEDIAAVRPLIDQAYDVFLDRVLEGRWKIFGDDEEALREVADGSIYTAEEAVENGLVDDIGYLDDAIDEAIRISDLPEGSDADRLFPIEDYLPSWRDFLGRTRGRRAAPEEGVRSALQVLDDPERLRLLLHEAARPRVLYLRP